MSMKCIADLLYDDDSAVRYGTELEFSLSLFPSSSRGDIPIPIPIHILRIHIPFIRVLIFPLSNPHPHPHPHHQSINQSAQPTKALLSLSTPKYPLYPHPIIP